MDIIKKLSLNKTPKDVQNGSIVCAKNMMVDDTGSFLTTDTGFDEVELPLKDNEFIVGVIPCNKEIAIFTYDGTVSRIYRKFDTGPVHYVKTNWHYGGGKITGTFTYNYKNELVLAVAESEAYKNGVLKNIPLKSFIIHKYKTPIEDPDYEGEIVYYAKPNQTYATEEIIPKVTCSNTISKTGSLVCGVYTFFIRYKIDIDNYTKWFQLTPELNIIRPKQSKPYLHKYLDKNNVEQTQTGQEVTVNAGGISDKAIILDLLIDSNEALLEEFQIGYIIKVGGDVQGRIQGEYKIEATNITITISNNLYIESETIENLVESPRALYNVETCCNYNNRLYLAGYKEYDNVNYDTSTISVSSDNAFVDPGANPSPPSNIRNITLQFVQYGRRHGNIMEDGQSYINYHKTYDLYLDNIVVDPDTGRVIDKNAFLSRIAPYIWLKDPNETSRYYLDGKIDSIVQDRYIGQLTTGNLYWIIQKADNSSAICIYSYTNVDVTPQSNWVWNSILSIPSFEIYIEPHSVKVEYNNISYYLFSESNPDKVGVLGYFYIDAPTPFRHYYSGNNIVTTTAQDNFPPHYPLEQYIVTSFLSLNINPDDKEQDEDAQGGGIPIVDDDANVNTRTLIPYQKYNFFIHYIRKDGSCTPGYHIKKVTFIGTPGNLFIPTFSGIINPDETKYIGWFISYEDVERNVDCLYITYYSEFSQHMTNAEYLYDLDTPRGDNTVIEAVKYNDITSKIHYKENRLTHNHLLVKTPLGTHNNCIALLIRNIDSYKNKAKILYRATKNIYTWNGCQESDYLPDYLNNQILISYTGNDGVVIDPAVPYVLGFASSDSTKNGKKTTYAVSIQEKRLYSKYPIEAMNIKQDYLQSAVVLSIHTPVENDDDIITDEMVINSLVTPDRLHDFLELQPAYQAKPSKSYINYREDNISQFNKTVYRSDVCSDESLVNGFRHFEANNYRNILENKGNITNIVGIGLYLIIHTEYSLFVFDRSPKLTQRNQLDIPDAFDIDYQEVMPANEGYGGLADKNESIITKHGYIWFDRTSKYIFRYDNGKVDIMSGDINNFIKYIEPTTVRFAEDTIHNRLMICIYYSDGNKFVTLSYNFITNTYISLHDYKFTHNYRTYNKSYVWDENIPKVLYIFNDEHSCNYGALESKQDYIFDCITSEPTEENPNNGDIRPYVDIICNEQPNVNKQLDAISYVLDLIKGSGYSFDIVKPTEENLNRRYSGRELRIYTDETDTDNLDIDVKQSAPRREDMTSYADTWRYPVYDKGKWLLNYFRNRINDAVNKSDTKSLIYGKYIVARFIFNKDDRVKLENVTFKINPY